MAGEDRDYVARVHDLPCRVAVTLHLEAEASLCYGPINAHHAGNRGVGQKAHDRTCIPLCQKHHAALHGRQEPFKGWDRHRMRVWQDEQVSCVAELLAVAKSDHVAVHYEDGFTPRRNR